MSTVKIIQKKLSLQNLREKITGTFILHQIEWIGTLNRKTHVKFIDETRLNFSLPYFSIYSWNLYRNKINLSIYFRDLQLEFFAVPAPPLNLSGSVNQSSVVLNWEPPVDFGSHSIMGYEIYRAENSPLIYIPIGTVSAGSQLEFVDTINPTTRYYYLIHAVSAAGRSAPSNGWSNQSGAPEPPGAQSVGPAELIVQLFVEG